jgi:hypothetical protein
MHYKHATFSVIGSGPLTAIPHSSTLICLSKPARKMATLQAIDAEYAAAMPSVTKGLPIPLPSMHPAGINVQASVAALAHQAVNRAPFLDLSDIPLGSKFVRSDRGRRSTGPFDVPISQRAASDLSRIFIPQNSQGERHARKLQNVHTQDRS